MTHGPEQQAGGETTRRRAVAVLGGRAGNAGSPALELAAAIGGELGRRGYGVVSGGDGGVAEAANRGCIGAGGETLALLKWNRVADCGPEITWSIPTSMDLARSNILNWCADGIIAFEGRYGTLGEIALALDTARPLVVLGEQPFLDGTALEAPSCRWFRNPRPEDAAMVVDAVESLMEVIEPAPVRPEAALFHSDVHDGSTGLRRAAAADLPMFAAAFSDPEVRRWWQRDANETSLLGLVHERCLAITEEGRAVGFIEYHSDPEPDFDHLGLDVVIAGVAHRGQGLGSRALTLFARNAFEAGHHRITVVPSPDNAAALGCYEKVGFQVVGVMREYERHRGVWRDAVLLDLLPGDLAPGGRHE